MGTSGSAPHVDQDDVQGVFSQLDEPSTPLTVDEVAAELECSRGPTRSTLETLAELGEVQTKRVPDGDRVWWQPQERGPTGQQSEPAEFSAFVSAVQDYAIFKLDPDGTVASWNKGAERIKGYRADEIVGEHFSTFYTEGDIDDGVPETNLDTARSTGRIEDEGWRVRNDGSRFWANVVITAVRDDDGELHGFTKVTRDMTERREYEQELRQERDLVEQILETTPVAIGVLDENSQFVRANSGMLDRHGIDESELSEYSLSAATVYDSEGDPIPEDEWPVTRTIETGEPVHDFQCQVDYPRGDRQWVSINTAPLEDTPADNDRVIVTVDDITRQKERERQLRRERDQTEQLLRTAPIAVAVQNADGETVLANGRAQEALGLSEREIVDEPESVDQWEIYDTDGTPLAPDETPAARVLATGEPVLGAEIRVDPPDGEWMEFHINAAPLFDAEGRVERVVTAGEDITELKKREAQLEQRKTELETELSQILGRISDSFYALDDEWRFTHLNGRAAETMEAPREELLGQEVWNVFPDAEGSVYWEELHEAMDAQEPVSFEVYEEGVDAWLEFNAYPSESGLSIYFRDITERKEREQRLEELVTKLEESNERLEQFAYAASHDLQEPLRMVSSYLQLIDQRYSDELDEDGEEFIEYAVDGAERMRDMIEGLLEYSRVETQGDPFEPTDLEVVVADVLDDLQFQIEESDAEITTESLPRVDGDAHQLRQVFQNLLNNAIEYSGEEPPQVHVAAERDRDEWVISVSDEGIGIDADDPNRIFEVFQRLHSQEEHAGTGIGLALCRRIVERHGGDIQVDSVPGEGATFSFTLPVAEGPDE